jgi:hypothetical protein
LQRYRAPPTAAGRPARFPGAARFVELPDTGHTFEHYENEQAAFKFKASAFDPRNANMIADWFRQHR